MRGDSGGRPSTRRRLGWSLVVALAVTAGSGAPGGLASSAPHTGPELPVPPAQICGNHEILDGPPEPPDGAVVVPAGDNRDLRPEPDTTYWFAPGVHTFGTGQYGQVIPADHDVFTGGPGAVLDGQRRNRYAFTQTAHDVTVTHLTVQHFGRVGGNKDEGVVNTSSGHGWTVEANTVRNNAGAGVFVASGSVVRDNCLSHNGQYGFSAYERHGVSDILLEHNEIVGNNTDDWEHREHGCGCTGGGKFWAVDGATVRDNWVHHNHGPGLWADTNDNDFAFVENYLDHNDGEGIEYEISYNALISGNTFVGNAIVAGRKNPGFPTGAVYLSESGGDGRVAARYATIEVSDNVFVDNWSGVVLWENADRFCNSPANTSTGSCTLVDPEHVNKHTCKRDIIDDEPYYSDCRWKTQHVVVHDNRFELDPSSIDGCTPAHSCGLQGLFSNWGSYPRWSPYMGPVIEKAITFHQQDVWRDNRYVGPWRFMAHDQGNIVGWSAWRAAPYRQDRGSTIGLQ